MGKKRDVMEYIEKETSRRTTFNKRKSGLLKKMDELLTLCGLSGTAIVYGENNPQPEVSPNLAEAFRVVNQFKSLPEAEQTKKMINNENVILEKKIEEARDELNKLRKKNKMMEMENLMGDIFQGKISLNDVSYNDMNDLSSMMEEKITMITELQVIHKIAGSSSSQPPPLPQLETQNETQDQGKKLDDSEMAEALLALKQGM